MVQSWNPACVNLKGLHDLLVEALVIEDACRTVNIRERKKRLQNYLPAVKEKATNTAARRLQFIRVLLVSQQESAVFHKCRCLGYLLPASTKALQGKFPNGMKNYGC